MEQSFRALCFVSHAAPVTLHLACSVLCGLVVVEAAAAAVGASLWWRHLVLFVCTFGACVCVYVRPKGLPDDVCSQRCWGFVWEVGRLLLMDTGAGGGA